MDMNKVTRPAPAKGRKLFCRDRQLEKFALTRGVLRLFPSSGRDSLSAAPPARFPTSSVSLNRRTERALQAASGRWRARDPPRSIHRDPSAAIHPPRPIRRGPSTHPPRPTHPSAVDRRGPPRDQPSAFLDSRRHSITRRIIRVTLQSYPRDLSAIIRVTISPTYLPYLNTPSLRYLDYLGPT